MKVFIVFSRRTSIDGSSISKVYSSPQYQLDDEERGSKGQRRSETIFFARFLVEFLFFRGSSE